MELDFGDELADLVFLFGSRQGHGNFRGVKSVQHRLRDPGFEGIGVAVRTSAAGYGATVIHHLARVAPVVLPPHRSAVSPQGSAALGAIGEAREQITARASLAARWGLASIPGYPDALLGFTRGDGRPLRGMSCTVVGADTCDAV